ncbi:phosphoribosylformylglycinamidine cyclo-ligase [soil metagenome]
MSESSYSRAGVAGQSDALGSVTKHLSGTFLLPRSGDVISGFGDYASVIRLSDELAVAVTTDGVGSKTMIASALDRYDTVGIDCVAMNVNDLVCVGATPLALVDYLGVNTLDPERVDGILEGLAACAATAGIAVPGGEIAQLPEVIGSNGRGPGGDERAFDLVGACIGTLRPGALIRGQEVRPGDALIGLASSGLHSNGYTLARRVLLKEAGLRLDEHITELGRTLGDELLTPTRIYVDAALALWKGGIETPGLVHVTGDGLANLCRLTAPAGYVIETMPPAPPIFDLISAAGGIALPEMYRVFNMGIGLVVVVPAPQVDEALAVLATVGYDALAIGSVSAEEGRVEIRPADLVGGMRAGDAFFAAART